MVRTFIQFACGLLVFLSANLFAQQDSTAFRSAGALREPKEKIIALEQFVKQFPDSKLSTRAFDGLFDLYLEQGNEAGAVEAATRSLASVIPQNRMNPYNRFAYALAQKSFGLDSALAWILRAEEIAQKIKSRSLSGFQDTRAFVLFKQKKYQEAEQLQRAAMKGNERDPEFLGHLALYEKENNKLHDALKTMAAALYFGGANELKTLFLDWITNAEKDKSKQEALRDRTVMSIVRLYVDTLKGVKLVSARSRAAMLMADLGVDLRTAKLWSLAAVQSLNKASSVDDLVAYKKSYAFVLLAEGKSGDALVQLRAIEELVDPYDARYWSTLGSTYEQVGDHKRAIDSYMLGLLPRNETQLRTALESLYTKQYGSLKGLDSKLDSMKQASTSFDPGHYGKPTTPFGKVILAELFTGADCGPCASSDVAFDALSEYYPRSALAILEYHVHVPGPDPMTTHESWERYQAYGGEGTPTAVIEGKEKILGGGSKVVTKNRFGVYKYAIQKVESSKPLANISLEVAMNGDDISIKAKVARTKALPSKMLPALHIALVERSVDYTGSNNISKHAYVVRKLLDGSSGKLLSARKPIDTFEMSTNVAAIEKGIKEYLDNPTVQPSWSTRRPFSGWKTRPEKLNRSNLAVVAWVQDGNSKSVLQAVYKDVPVQLGSK